MSDSTNQKIDTSSIQMGFLDETVLVRVADLIPSKPITKSANKSKKYKQIISSIEEIGIIEPPVVTPDGNNGRYIILDGHFRIEALKRLSIEEVTCLISTDDEAFTYNKHINRLSTIQEHKMIQKAVERGVPEEKIAKALNVNVRNIISKRNLLEGICAEATDLLKDKIVAGTVFTILRKMRPMRQIEMAQLMNDSNVYSVSYARVLMAATPKDQFINPERPKKVRGLSDDQMARMEREMNVLEQEYKLAEETYSNDVLYLTLAKGYLSKLLNNNQVVKYLSRHHAEILEQFQLIAELETLQETEESI